MMLDKIKKLIMKYCNLGKLKTMTTLEKLDLLDKLNRYDESVSRLIDNADISKHILLPKWKIWLLLRIFGEKKCECDDSFATQALDLFDDALDWSELPFEAQIAAYKNNENFITAAIYYDKALRKEIGSLNEALDQLSELVPNKVSVNNTVYFKDNKTLKFECWAKFKRVLGIEVSKNYKTSISYFDKEVFPCKGLENETVMGPKWNRVMVAPIVAEIFRQIGALDDDQNNNKKEEKIEMDNLLEKKFTNFFEKEEERMKNLFTLCDKLLNMAPFDEVNKLFEISLQKLNERMDFLNNFKKGLESKKEEKEECKECCRNKTKSIRPSRPVGIGFDVKSLERSTASSIIKKIINKVNTDEQCKKEALSKVDNFCRRVVKKINSDKEWDRDEKCLAIIAIKLNHLIAIFFGPEKAKKFFYNTLSTDPSFKRIVGDVRNKNKIKEIYNSAFMPVRDGFYGIENPIFENNICTISARQCIKSDKSYDSSIILKGNNFALRIANNKHESPYDGLTVELVRNLEDDSDIFGDTLNITSSTKLIDMINFVLDKKPE